MWSGLVSKDQSCCIGRRAIALSQEYLLLANARYSHCAIEDGQYWKVSQALTGSSAPVSECLTTDGPSPLLPAPVPSQVRISVEVLVAARKYSSIGSAPDTSFRASHLTEANFCPSLGRTNSALSVLLEVYLLCVGNVHTKVVPHLSGT